MADNNGVVTGAKFQELLARARANLTRRKEEEAAEATIALATSLEEEKVEQVDLSSLSLGSKPSNEDVVEVLEEISSSVPEQRVRGVSRDDITLNEKQSKFSTLVQEGEDCVLIGAAGTGKTTSMRQTTRKLIEVEGRLPKLTSGTKYLSVGNPGGAILSYTRKAVNNIRHAVVDELKQHTLTIHKLLEFAPVFYEVEDPSKPGAYKKTMRFEPSRHAGNPLPADLIFLAFEESSMVSVELYQQLQAAMPHPHQEVFLGDIQQLPPIFGLAILGFKMLELPVVELTEVYRQALDSPIISLAWKILEGNPHAFSPRSESYKSVNRSTNKEVTRIRCPALDEFSKITDSGEVKIQIWQKQLSPDLALITCSQQFIAWANQGYYQPEQDIILCPFNKAFGTIELNKAIANHLGKKRGATVNEVIAGFNKHYLAIGDRVLYDKEDAYITEVRTNGSYLGKRGMPPSVNLDRWGHLTQELEEGEQLQFQLENEEMDLEAIEKFMDSAASAGEDRVQAASHVVCLRYAFDDGTGTEVVLDAASEINNLLGGYAITVHKFQGSEEERIFFVMHNSHSVMNQRELLYTAVTRAKKFLHVIAEKDTFWKGVQSQRIKGNSLKEKAEWFKGKQEKDGIAFDAERLKHNSLKKSGWSSVAHLIKEIRAPAVLEVEAPGHTDLMVSPESINKFMEEHPLLEVEKEVEAPKELTVAERVKLRLEELRKKRSMGV